MWKHYLEREDSKIVGMEPGKAVGFGLGRRKNGSKAG